MGVLVADSSSGKSSLVLAYTVLFLAASALCCVTLGFMVVLRNNIILVLLLSVFFLFFLAVFVNLILNQTTLSLKKNIMLPLPINRYFSGILFRVGIVFAKLAGKKEEFERSYITFDSELVSIKKLKLEPAEILVLLPRCIQNNDCKFNVVNNMENCSSCGKCDIKEIKEAIKATGVKVSIIAGGSQARALVKKNMPKAIIAVACERELISGIFDVPNCEVVGLINERPEGPCVNTRASVSKLKETITNFLEGK